jgi:hypothetical protein
MVEMEISVGLYRRLMKGKISVRPQISREIQLTTQSVRTLSRGSEEQA